jgi:hypothetical protein
LRGLGQGIDVGTLNCPGDPGCPGYVAPGSPEYIQSLQDELTRMYTQGGPIAPVGTSTITDWLNANSKLLLIAGAGLFVAIVLGKAAR